mgnify:CR=1 FL=1
MIKDHTQPDRRDVADIAGRGGRNMGSAETSGDDAVVTTAAGAGDLGEIDYRIDRGPGAADVAGLADVAGIDMRWAFRSGRATAMATKAVIHDACVTKDYANQPSIRHMAGITFLSGGGVSRGLAAGDHAVMTTGTSRSNASVIK